MFSLTNSLYRIPISEKLFVSMLYMNKELINSQKRTLERFDSLQTCEKLKCTKQKHATIALRQKLQEHYQKPHIMSNKQFESNFKQMLRDFKNSAEFKNLTTCSVNMCQEKIDMWIDSLIETYKKECDLLRVSSSCNKHFKPKDTKDNYVNYSR